ncbi:MAG: HAD-IIA family hydrolase [Clostridiaceae bacterium]|nr:HAD-IIA family hydrolase [Clostridiaceae bacterium]
MIQNKQNINNVQTDKLKDIKCLFLDMDGTFYVGNQILPGSLEFLREAAKRDLEILFLTNNSSRSAEYYVEKLKNMGVKSPFLNVLTSGQATGRYVLKNFPTQKGFLLANSIVTAEMEKIGLQIDEQNPDYVLITYDTELDYKKLDRVCHFVRAGLPYIASHPDFNCPMEYGFAPDIGATIAYVAASTGREPDVIIGKPHKFIIEDAISLVNQKKEHIAMVGDRLYTDIAAAIDNGLLGILVMSGETDQKMLAKSEIKPDLVFERLIDIVGFLD